MGTGLDVQMRDSDAFSWYMEADPLMRSTIVVVAALDGSPEWERVVDKYERLTRQVPLFRQRVVRVPLPGRLVTPRWAVDPAFDLSWHLRRVSAPEAGDLAWVLDMARKSGMASFDRDRPLWETTFVDGLGDGRAAVIMKLHHSITDGVGGMQMALLLYDVQAEPVDLGPLPEAPVAGGHHAGTDLDRAALGYQARRARDFALHQLATALPRAAHALRHPASTVSDTLETTRSVYRMVAPINRTLSPVMTERRLGWHYDMLEVPLDDLHHAAKLAGGSLNDGFLAGVTGGLRRYHETHGAPVESLRVTLPISIRAEDDPVGGNRITLLRFPMPVGIADPAARVAALHDLVLQARQERSLPHTNTVAAALNLLPSSFVGAMIKHVDFVASDVPGFSFPVYLGGAKLLTYCAFGPTIGTALNVTLLSYCGTCYVGVNTDVGAVTDPDVLLDSLAAGFEEVLDLGGAHEAVRIPLRAGAATR